MEIEKNLGYDPIDRELEKLGYDIESRIPNTGKLRFIEVKGRISSARTLTVTRNEILYSLNKPDDFILAIVEFMGNDKDMKKQMTIFIFSGMISTRFTLNNTRLASDPSAPRRVTYFIRKNN